MSDKTLQKTVKQFFLIRIGKYELILWEITNEGIVSVEKERPNQE